MLRSISSVIAGFATWSLLWIASNGALAAALPDLFREDGTTESSGILACVLVVSVVCSLLAGYVTATTAKNSPMQKVWILALIQMAIGIAVQASYWSVIPLWYNLLFLALLVPMHVAGGNLRLRTGRVPEPAL